MSFCVVPGNIKQLMLPFVLNPNDPINTIEDPSTGASASPLIFTFRTLRWMSKKPGILNFCPTVVKNNIDKDISMQLTYDSNVTNGSKNKMTYANMLDSVPGLQIREFLPDTALDQCINFFTDMIKSFSQLFGKDGLTKKTDDLSIDASSDKFEIDKFAKKILNVCWFAVQYLSGTGKDNIVNAIASDLKGYKGTAYSGKATILEDKILKFPYMLYYKFLSCTTTSIYEVPCLNTNGKHMYSSDGTPGWDDDAGFSVLPKAVSNLPLIGGLLGKLFGNMNISFMPWWNALKGNASKEPSVVVLFDLFNDTEEAAITNFIFVNTIVPNNKWILYGLFLHSPHLYDIKLEGYNRLFACTGKFEVNYDGVLRDPPKNWYLPNGPLAGHVNANLDKANFLKSLESDKSIKIPDIYRVTLTFDSLLPANFNNYLYTLVCNKDSIDTYEKTVYDSSALATALPKAIKGFVSGVLKVWKEEDKTDYTKKQT